MSQCGLVTQAGGPPFPFSRGEAGRLGELGHRVARTRADTGPLV